MSATCLTFMQKILKFSIVVCLHSCKENTKQFLGDDNLYLSFIIFYKHFACEKCILQILSIHEGEIAPQTVIKQVLSVQNYQHFFEKLYRYLTIKSKLCEELNNDITFLVGQAGLELLNKTWFKIVFWSITQKPLDPLHFHCHCAVTQDILL